MDLYEVYIRDVNGNTYHPEDVLEGIKQFLSDDGYRLSFNIEGTIITLRKNHPYDDDVRRLDDFLGQDSVECMVTFR